MKASERLAAARLAGYSWADIHGYLGERRATAEAWGYTPPEINSFLGYKDPAALDGRLSDLMVKPRG